MKITYKDPVQEEDVVPIYWPDLKKPTVFRFVGNWRPKIRTRYGYTNLRTGGHETSGAEKHPVEILDAELIVSVAADQSND